MLRTVVWLRFRLARFWEDDLGGERDTLTTLLILALIIIPLVLVIIAFGDELITSAQDAWDEVMGGGLTP